MQQHQQCNNIITTQNKSLTKSPKKVTSYSIQNISVLEILPSDLLIDILGQADYSSVLQICRTSNKISTFVIKGVKSILRAMSIGNLKKRLQEKHTITN